MREKFRIYVQISGPNSNFKGHFRTNFKISGQRPGLQTDSRGKVWCTESRHQATTIYTQMTTAKSYVTTQTFYR